MADPDLKVIQGNFTVVDPVERLVETEFSPEVPVDSSRVTAILQAGLKLLFTENTRVREEGVNYDIKGQPYVYSTRRVGSWFIGLHGMVRILEDPKPPVAELADDKDFIDRIDQSNTFLGVRIAADELFQEKLRPLFAIEGDELLRYSNPNRFPDIRATLAEANYLAALLRKMGA